MMTEKKIYKIRKDKMMRTENERQKRQKDKSK